MDFFSAEGVGRGGVGVAFGVESLVKQEFSGRVHSRRETRSERDKHTLVGVAVLVSLPSSYVVLSWTHLVLEDEEKGK